MFRFDPNTKFNVSKSGTSINVIWDEAQPVGKINVVPASPCPQLAQAAGGLSTTVVTLNAPAGLCAKPLIEGVSTGAGQPCPGETHEYRFNYRAKGYKRA